jgi:hypothetical protein
VRAVIASRAATLALAALALAACGDNSGNGVSSKLCADFRTPAAGAPAAAPADAATPVDDCVRRWAYTLAGSRDGADVVAKSAVAACGGALTRWNQASLNDQPGGAGGAPAQTLSLDTGEPTTALAEHNAFAQRQALLYVIEARAAHCRPPRIANGRPVGT